MKITFLGVGEACDLHYPNSSYLVESQNATVMLDCGRSSPEQYWKLGKDPNFVDAISVSHSDFDHCFGIPAILVRMYQEGRNRPITIVSSPVVESYLYTLCHWLETKFPVIFERREAGETITVGNLHLSFARTVHHVPNLAIRLTDGTRTVCYSGDGLPTPFAKRLYKGADLLIQEGYFYNRRHPDHECMVDAMAMAEECGVTCLAIVHVQRDFRSNDLPRLRDTIKSDRVKIIIPELMDVYEL